MGNVSAAAVRVMTGEGTNRERLRRSPSRRPVCEDGDVDGVRAKTDRLVDEP
jgi:hypothetical protein